MLNRAVFARPVVQKNANQPRVAQRAYPGGKGELKQVSLRRAGCRMVKKITGTMKLVAAAKARTLENEAKHATPFFTGLFKVVEENIKDELAKKSGKAEEVKRVHLYFGTDKGLCGPINTQLTRALLKEKEIIEGDEMISVGEKGFSAMTANLKVFNPQLTFHQTGRKDTSFTELGVMSDVIMETMEYDVLTIWYNKFINAASYKVSAINVPSFKYMTQGNIRSKCLKDFDRDDGDVNNNDLRDLVEFMTATALNQAYKQTLASEMASRQAAMENATKNADELIRKLNLKFNQIRQNIITTELVEITSGAKVIKARKEDAA
mmetsp:Transcript_15939/g.17697  ORF Transcript_15939/g.17697 Transcript_15939/m.17697 type:complete len:321 (+) Transcript_15939:39-1001(+)|eukprot:CAMPEP_0168527142 /NCGR_PEP_ID=MMETSP0405-20121227/12412_1 /TAXON_ID=498012 /ORGANISM="Trichosphaerium sp, Strain Am-I-7 wt" /LENGTH=320 /DNA_ID=CAMNT_0008550169 /DNA_START=15 /DNA_END=977 /DNA_ORIENTATION=+